MTESIVESLFDEVCSDNFLNFSFNGRSYSDQLEDSIRKSKSLAAIKVTIRKLPLMEDCGSEDGNFINVVWVQHDFAFMGGSLGCAEGEKITRAFEYGSTHSMPVIVACKSGGARMQEGTSSLMQMAKVSVAVDAHRSKGFPFIAILSDPTYGGVSASYAMQADVKIATNSDNRIGFAGPQVILNTMCGGDQAAYDVECPADFQSATYLLDKGQVDLIFESDITDNQVSVHIANICAMLSKSFDKEMKWNKSVGSTKASGENAHELNYTLSRGITRPQAQDIIETVFDKDSFIELSGDGKVGSDVCLRGGLARLDGKPCVVMGTFKGHTPGDMQAANYGMPSPHGYRTALRLMQLAERFDLPILTLVDTVGAWPTFQCEGDGQSEAIATNLTTMAGLKVPIVTLLTGEGGSGGALGIGMGNIIGMLSGGYFGVISPEGAASILGRYKDAAHKAIQFPKDCQELASAQGIYAPQLKDMGIVDEIIWETGSETFSSFSDLSSKIKTFVNNSWAMLSAMPTNDLIAHRYNKFRSIGKYKLLDVGKRTEIVELALATPSKKSAPKKKEIKADSLLHDKQLCLVLDKLAEISVCGDNSRYLNKAPKDCPLNPPTIKAQASGTSMNAKSILDSKGPVEMAKWVRTQSQVLLTDTTMRDAHQSLLATRVRTKDIVGGAILASTLLDKAFSLECWGGATFDVCMRFLDEDPWERLRAIRAACPNICLQMLIRGANAVGYTSYPDNAVAEFVRLAALNGMDVFRIFDCFNDIENMRVTIDAVRKANKVAEVCICYTGNLLTDPVYNVDYYRGVAKSAVDAGAHILGIKDMAGLLRPLEAKPLLEAIRSVTPDDIPIHFHTHATSGGAIATVVEMANGGCDIVDLATAALADGTSQPSLNAFVAMMSGGARDTGIDFMSLEPYDMYWMRTRSMYGIYESGMLSGSARVFEHQIPGGQYTNLLVQCKSMGMVDRWEEILDAYRDANSVLGNVIKVTPSSKCVGDLALYLVNRRIPASELMDPVKGKSIDFPESVVGLFRGDLGFPHRGFPTALEENILRGQERRKIRAGLVLPPINFDENIENLVKSYADKSWNGGKPDFDELAGMSSIMYPKVYGDYLDRMLKQGRYFRHLPTPQALHGCAPGEGPFTLESIPNTNSGPPEPLVISLDRIGPIKAKRRMVYFTIKKKGAMDTEEYSVSIKDSSGGFEFEGPMADTTELSQLGSPMPGVIEKILVSANDRVNAGDTLAIVSAMKMEVKVTAPDINDGSPMTVTTISVNPGDQVIEGALVMTLK
jgi:acetyl-CoA carboxylase carboxyl transferase alpha subunit